jgi:membrane-associated phospholipid phosphatase
VTLTRAPSDDLKSAPRTGSTGGSASGAATLLKDTLSTLAQWIAALVRRPQARLPRPPAIAYAAAAVTLLAIICSMFYLDAAASDWAKHLPLSLTGAFEEITNFGLSGWFLVPFGLIVLLLAAAMSPALPHISRAVLASLAARFGFLFLAIGAPGLFVTIAKRLIGRARPYVGAFDDPFAYLPFVWRPEYASMPSGHATTAASAAIAIGAIWPRTRGVMWLYALIIMLSRVIVLAHHPSDVIAGGLVGVIGALLVRRWFAARCLVFSAADLRAYPGPSLRRIGAVLRQATACR